MKHTTGKLELTRISQLFLDSQLAKLRSAARAKEECEQQLAGLSIVTKMQGSLEGVSAALSELNYQRWAEARRSELNRLLANRTVKWIEARDEAVLIFGKHKNLKEIVGSRPQIAPRGFDS